MSDPLDPDGLRQLLRGGAKDRAYVDAMIRMGWARQPDRRAVLGEIHEALRIAALEAHAPVRERIARGEARGPTLRALFDAVPTLERDHVVEEILGIAYPPLEEGPPEPELISYQASGYDEIVHAFDVTALSKNDRLLDIGSGMGKVVLLASLLSDASCTALERDAVLHTLAVAAAGTIGVRATFIHRDAREHTFPAADVIFMYIPFTGSTLSGVLSRLEGYRFLCTSSLDLRNHPNLEPIGASKSWLNVYGSSVTRTK